MDLQVIDNFLGDYQFKSLQTILMSNDFPWFYNYRTLPPSHPHHNPKIFQFTHVFFNSESGQISPVYADLMGSLTSKLNVRRLIRLKANLNTRTLFHRRGGYHIDMDYKCKTAVYYLNTNNGWTEFKKGGKVKSVANRIVIFDSNQEHQGVSCTDENVRLVINFNYE